MCTSDFKDFERLVWLFLHGQRRSRRAGTTHGKPFFPLKETRYGTLLFRQDERFVWVFKGVSCSGGSAASSYFTTTTIYFYVAASLFDPKRHSLEVVVDGRNFIEMNSLSQYDT